MNTIINLYAIYEKAVTKPTAESSIILFLLYVSSFAAAAAAATASFFLYYIFFFVLCVTIRGTRNIKNNKALLCMAIEENAETELSRASKIVVKSCH